MDRTIYKRINPGTIRLLLILPGDSHEKVQCVLEAVPLSLFNAPSRSLANYVPDTSRNITSIAQSKRSFKFALGGLCP